MMHQRQRLFLLSMFSCIALGLSAQEEPVPVGQTPPATVTATQEGAGAGETVKVAEHWSKWDYPKEVSVPKGCQMYLVVKGDCLWNLGKQFLGNPFSWPQIWEQNKWIADPHWIYPGDPLIIPIDKKAMGTAGTTPETPGEVANLKPERIRIFQKPIQEEYAYTKQDFLQMPYLAPKGAEAAMKEAGALNITQRKAKNRSILGDTETVYLSGGEDRGLKVNDKLLVVKVRARDIKHPNTPEKDPTTMGDVLEQVGIIKVVTLNPKGAIAVIEKSGDALEVGDYVVPYTEPVNIPAKLRTDIQGEVKLQEPVGTIFYARDQRMNTSVGHMVLIDKGSKDNLQMGDVLLCARSQTWPVGEDAAPKSRSEEKAMERKGSGGFLDRLTSKVETQGKRDTMQYEKTTYYVGQLVVVRVGETSSTCRILRSVEEIMIGDLAGK